MNQPEPWIHESGYRLNADGKAIWYSHPETGFEAYIEASLNEYDYKDSVMEYIPAIFDETGTLLTYENFEDQEDALSHLKELMEAYA